jgi:hypothetical protein
MNKGLDPQGLKFTEFSNYAGERHRSVTVDAHHPEVPYRIRVTMTHDRDVHPSGTWDINTIGRLHDHESAHTPLFYSRKNANTIGPGVIRALARHLKQTYGVQRVTGWRITGVRRGGSKNSTPNVLLKADHSLAIDEVANTGFRLTLHVKHPKSPHTVRVNMTRNTLSGIPDSWNVDSVHAVDKWGLEVPGAFHRRFSNTMGPTAMRQLARHLKENYGVHQVQAYRATGMRGVGHKNVNIRLR